MWLHNSIFTINFKLIIRLCNQLARFKLFYSFYVHFEPAEWIWIQCIRNIFHQCWNCFRGVRVTWSLVLYVCFVDRCLCFCPFSFGHCVVCPSSIYGFWLPPFGIIKLFLPKLLFDATNLFISLNIIIDKKHCEPTKCYKLYTH